MKLTCYTVEEEAHFFKRKKKRLFPMAASNGSHNLSHGVESSLARRKITNMMQLADATQS